ncbi:tigger transposable element-derived protein 4-like [Schistocerca nitens]|uniref:tigger transposable element-derived protein 4-like n=1 Tax=Schistocerca nitens TaxID=7011 RepID=UPI0021182842|nr:tigger transposable element-derived protein 4-like [Schistocerca nitens]
MGEKQKNISLEDKVSIIKKVEASPGVSHVELAKQLGLAPSTLNTIMKNRSSIMEGFENCGNSKRTRLKQSTYDEMEKVLLTWFQQARAANIPINGTILKEKVLQISLQLGMDNFKASNGWIDKFRQHHGVVYKLECGDSKSVDEPTVAQWIQTLPNLIQGYKLRDIYNADETGMFFNLMPDKTFTFRGENCTWW